jgi:ferredoxin
MDGFDRAGKPGASATGVFQSGGTEDGTSGTNHGSGAVLELTVACDVRTRWSCQTGVCQTCECGLIDIESWSATVAG